MSSKNSTIPQSSFFGKVLAFILSFGPGIFAIGYTIGTGSVISYNDILGLQVYFN